MRVRYLTLKAFNNSTQVDGAQMLHPESVKHEAIEKSEPAQVKKRGCAFSQGVTLG